MRKTQTSVSLDPRHRVLRVTLKLKHPDTSIQLDQWEKKLINIYKLRSVFKDKYPKIWHTEFEQSFPLYSKLLDVYEGSEPGGDKDVIESALLSGVKCDEIVDKLNLSKFDPLFLALYRDLFYDVLPILGNPVAEFQFIVSPILRAGTNKLPIGAIWKVLALVGGISALRRKGFGTEPMKAEDISYLLQLAAFRNCSMIMQYTTSGMSFFEDNPGALAILNTLADFDGIRGTGRRIDFLAEVSDVAKNNISVLLSENLKLLSTSDDIVESLVGLDGAFNVDKGNTIERHEHVNFLDNIQEVSSED